MFKIGDRVSAFGCEGVVTSIHGNTFPIVVDFSGVLMKFMENGKLHDWHPVPSLVLVERKTKVNYQVAQNVQFLNQHGVTHAAIIIRIRETGMADLLCFDTKGESYTIPAVRNADALECFRLLTGDHHAVEVEID